MRLFKFFFFSFLPLLWTYPFFNAFSLDYREKISSSIEKISPDRTRIIIDKGKEDGIIIRDMAKFYIKGKFLMTAVCIVSNMEYSEWVIYNTYAKKLIIENIKVDIVSMYGSKKPYVSNLEEVQSTSFLHKLKAEEVKRKEKEQNKKREEQEKLLLKKYALNKYKRFQIPNIVIGLNASPLSFKSPYHDRYLSYGLTTTNVDQKEYEFKAQVQQKNISYTNPIQGDKYTANKTYIEAIFDNKDFWKSFNSYSFFELKMERVGTVYPIKHQFSIGPLGLKYPFQRFSKVQRLDIVYVPLIEFYASDRNNFQRSLENKQDISEGQDSYLRHAILIYLGINFTRTLKLTNDFSWRPKNNFTTGKLDLQDVDLSDKLAIHYNIFPQLAFSYQSHYSWDPRRKNHFSLPASEWENSLHLHYQFNLDNFAF